MSCMTRCQVDTDNDSDDIPARPADELISNDLSADPEQEPAWDDSLDADGDPDLTWDVEEEQETASNESIATLSSKTSKRSFHEVENYEDDAASQASSPGQ